MTQTCVRTRRGSVADGAPGIAIEAGRKRIPGANRREQLLETAAAEFAGTGLRGTTTAALASRAGISEPILYLHFESKDSLFRETVERSIDKRLQLLGEKLAHVSGSGVLDSIERMAEATVAVCVSDGTNPVLTTWALLETPEYAIDLHRAEVGSVCLLWERALAARFPESRTRAVLSMRLVPHAVHACLAYGFWLAAFRHSPASAAPLARQFAGGIKSAAATLISSDV